MSVALPSIAHASRRLGARIVLSGALAVGLLATAPTLDEAAHAAPQSVQHHAQKKKPQRAPSAGKVARAMNVAVAQKGNPYAYGASGPSAFDCSGLVFYSYRKAGFKHIPRTTGAQSHFVKRIPRSAMKRGDLMFFTDGGGVYHVGVYAGFTHGRRWVLHAPYSGTRVRTDRVWTDRWFAGTLRHR